MATKNIIKSEVVTEEITFCEANTLPEVTADDIAAVSEYIAVKHGTNKGGRYYLDTKSARLAMADIATLATSRPMLAKTLGAILTKGLTPFKLMETVREVRVCFRTVKDGEKWDASKGDASKGERVFLTRSRLA